MGFVLLKNLCLLIILVLASITSSSSAVRCGSSTGFVMTNFKDENGATENQEAMHSGEEEEILPRDEIHERLLRSNTKDYGRYDPAPTFVKPPFKLIPN